MRGFVGLCAAACAALIVGGCGAASEAFQTEFEQQIRANLPGGGSTKPATTGTSSGPSSTTVDASRDISIAAMLQKHNALRSQLGLGQLKMDTTLSLVAQRQAAYNASIGTISHADATGGQVWDRASAAGYDWSHIGENLAYSTNPSHIFELWVNSPGHYKNMTNPVYTQIGLGKVTSGRGEYWCAVFATH